MTTVVNVTEPRVVVIDHGTSCKVEFAGGDSLLVTTQEECNALIGVLHRIGWHFEQASMLRGAREDRVAGRLVNEAFAEANSDWPGGTFAPAFTRQQVVRIPVEGPETAA